jgi:hypothetical protein
MAKFLLTASIKLLPGLVVIEEVTFIPETFFKDYDLRYNVTWCKGFLNTTPISDHT